MCILISEAKIYWIVAKEKMFVFLMNYVLYMSTSVDLNSFFS